MSYNNGVQDALAASQLPFRVKAGIIQAADRASVDDALPNAWIFYADNAAGTDKIPYLVPVDTNNQTFLGNPNGVGLYELSVVQVATPAAPTITNSGTAGSTTDAYKIVARNGRGASLGTTPASSAGTTTTANATLSATNFNVITFAKVDGAAFYDIYRTTAAGTPSTTGKIGTVTATRTAAQGLQTATYTFNDTGLVADGTTAPTTNTTGVLSVSALSGDIKLVPLTTPTNVVATPQGTVGSTTITYKVVARSQVGVTAASSAGTTTTANATLTAGNNVLVTWNAVPDAVSYDVYRTAAGGTPNSTGLVGNVLAPLTSLTDTGLTGDSSTAPTVNTTGALAIARIDDASGNPEIILTATASAVNQLTLANAATGTAPTFTASGSDTNIGIVLAGKGSGVISAKSPFTATQAPNYIASETGSANTIAGALLDANGVAVALAAGLRVVVKLANTLQAGANTFNLNAGGAVAIKKHTNAATDLSVAYANTGVIDLLYTGSVWADMSQ